MDKNGSEAPGNWQVFCQLTTRQLVVVSQGLGDELRRRSELELDPTAKHYLFLANVRLAEARAYLRKVQSAQREATTPAVPVSDPQHGAAKPEGSPESVPSQTGSTTTGAAGVVPVVVAVLEPQPGVRYPPFYARQVCPRCTEDFGHEGECRPLEEPETAPTLNSPDHAASDAARAEGAHQEDREAGRLDGSRGGRVELADHLRVLKGGAA